MALPAIKLRPGFLPPAAPARPRLRLVPSITSPILAVGPKAANSAANGAQTAAANGTAGAAGTNGVNGGGSDSIDPIEKLEKLGLRNLTKRAREGDLNPVFERSEEVQELQSRLLGNHHALLLGNTGVGKSAIVEALALEWKDQAKTCFFNFGMTDIDRSALEPQLKQIVATAQEARRQGYNIYFLMDELHNFEQAGILELLKEPLGRPEFGFIAIGATTTKEYYRYFNNEATKRRFGDPIVIKALEDNKLRRVVSAIIPAILTKLGLSLDSIEIGPRARQAAIDISPLIIGRYAPEVTIYLLNETIGAKRSQVDAYKRVLTESRKNLTTDINDIMEYMQDPRMAADVAKIWKSIFSAVNTYFETIARLNRVLKENESGKMVISDDDIRFQATKLAGVDLTRMDELDALQLAQVEAKIRTRLIGQDQAVKTVSGAIKRYKAGRRKKNAPIATFLFTGPTGTGKTELAHILAWLLFGDAEKVMTIDMTKCNGKGGKTLLFGADPGFVGFETTDGMLPDLLKQKENRHGILFFDEADKADREVYESLLVVLDQGYVQNKKSGEKYSLEDIVVILASNQGEEQMIKPDQIRELVDKHVKEARQKIEKQLEGVLGQKEAFKNDPMELESLEAEAQKCRDQLTGFNENLPNLRKEIISKLVENNRKIAAASFKDQKDEYGREKYSPAFLNRLEIVPFDYLTDEDIAAIADIMLKNFVKQVETDQKLEIILGENDAEYQAIKAHLLSLGTDLINGARPLKRAIETYLDNPFSSWLGETLPSGEYIIKVSIKEAKFVFEETRQKSERGKQIDVSHHRGQKGLVLRKIVELVMAGKSIAQNTIDEILSAPKGLAKVELWLEDHPFPEGDNAVKAKALAEIKKELDADDLEILKSHVFTLLMSKNYGLLALALSLAKDMNLIKAKDRLEELTNDPDPFIVDLAKQGLSKFTAVSDFHAPIGRLIIPAGNKDKVDPQITAFLAGFSGLLEERKIKNEHIEAVRRAVNTLILIAKQRQEKASDPAKQGLSLVFEWKLGNMDDILIKVSNSNTEAAEEEPKLADFRTRYVSEGRELKIAQEADGTLFCFSIPGRKSEAKSFTHPFSAYSLESLLSEVTAQVDLLNEPLKSLLSRYLPLVAAHCQKVGQTEEALKQINRQIKTDISPGINPKVVDLESLLKFNAPGWDDSRKNDIISALLSTQSSLNVPTIEIIFKREADTIELDVCFTYNSLPDKARLKSDLQDCFKQGPGKEIYQEIKTLGGNVTFSAAEKAPMAHLKLTIPGNN